MFFVIAIFLRRLAGEFRQPKLQRYNIGGPHSPQGSFGPPITEATLEAHGPPGVPRDVLTEYYKALTGAGVPLRDRVFQLGITGHTAEIIISIGQLDLLNSLLELQRVQRAKGLTGTFYPQAVPLPDGRIMAPERYHQTVLAHTMAILELMKATFVRYPELTQNGTDSPGVDPETAAKMVLVHDFGELTLGDLPASADPTSFGPFQDWLRQGDHQNPSPLKRQQLWIEFVGIMRKKEVQCARETIFRIPDRGIAETLFSLYERFEKRRPEDRVANLARLLDVTEEIITFTTQGGWNEVNYQGTVRPSDLLRSLDISIRRLLEPVVNLVYSFDEARVYALHQLVTEIVQCFASTDFPCRTNQVQRWLEEMILRRVHISDNERHRMLRGLGKSQLGAQNGSWRYM